MHNNYFFLRQLTKELTTLLLNSTIEECFSQQKDELIIIFRKDAERIFLQAHLTANFSCLYFPKDFNRAKRNTASLFSELNNQKITGIIQAENERAFSFTFNSDFSLMFKLFGTRANIILYKKSDPFLLFKNKLNQDWNLKLNQNRAQDLSLESFEKNNWSKEGFVYAGRSGRKICFV